MFCLVVSRIVSGAFLLVRLCVCVCVCVHVCVTCLILGFLTFFFFRLFAFFLKLDLKEIALCDLKKKKLCCFIKITFFSLLEKTPVSY